jgi:hypothetical protein
LKKQVCVCVLWFFLKKIPKITDAANKAAKDVRKPAIVKAEVKEEAKEPGNMDIFEKKKDLFEIPATPKFN